MLRRRFLRQALAAIIATPGVVAARTTPDPTPPSPGPLLLQASPLAGFQYHQGPQLWPYLSPGDALTLVREPNNPYDPGAVRIDWQDHQLGYLPRVDNTAVSQLLDRGHTLTARINALREALDPWQRITLEVWVTD